MMFDWCSNAECVDWMDQELTDVRMRIAWTGWLRNWLARRRYLCVESGAVMQHLVGIE